VGRTFEYRLTDRSTGISRNVTYQVDRIDGDRVIFNQGSRVEKLTGEVLSISGPLGGDVDVAMPPGGWIKPGAKIGSGWSERFAASPLQQQVGMDLEARVTGEAVLSLAGQQIHTLQVQFTGFTDRAITLPANASGRYRAVLWYAPELRRVIRFEVYSKGGSMSSAFVIDEVFELVDIR
jgi:serine protease Do